jgi:hypothetical protein
VLPLRYELNLSTGMEIQVLSKVGTNIFKFYPDELARL